MSSPLRDLMGISALLMGGSLDRIMSAHASGVPIPRHPALQRDLAERERRRERVQSDAAYRRDKLFHPSFNPPPPTSRIEALHAALNPLRYVKDKKGLLGVRRLRGHHTEQHVKVSPVRAAVVHRIWKALCRAGVDLREGAAALETETDASTLHPAASPRRWAAVRLLSPKGTLTLVTHLPRGWRRDAGVRHHHRPPASRRITPWLYPRASRPRGREIWNVDGEPSDRPLPAVRLIALHCGGSICRACESRVAAATSLLGLFCRHCDTLWHAREADIGAAVRLCSPETIPALRSLGLDAIQIGDRRWIVLVPTLTMDLVDLEDGTQGWRFLRVVSLVDGQTRIDPEEALMRLTDIAVQDKVRGVMHRLLPFRGGVFQ